MGGSLYCLRIMLMDNRNSKLNYLKNSKKIIYRYYQKKTNCMPSGHFNGIKKRHRRILQSERTEPYLMWYYCWRSESAWIMNRKRMKNVKNPKNTKIYIDSDDYLLIKYNTNLFETIYNNNNNSYSIYNIMSYYYNCTM